MNLFGAGRVPCPLLCSTSAHGSDPAEILGDAAVAVSLTVMDVLVIMQRRWVATVEVPQIQFIARVGGKLQFA